MSAQKIFFCVLCLIPLLLAACDDSPPPFGSDASLPDAGRCGNPDNEGNSIGVGQYCMDTEDCPATADLCVPLFGEGMAFCTKLCPMEGSPECMENARCACAGAGCTCVPAECDEPSR